MQNILKDKYHFLDTPNTPPGTTRFWLIRHAIVEEKSRQFLYGTMDVSICPDHLVAQKRIYQFLAKRLPKNGIWFTSPLKRTQQTAKAIQKEGYGSKSWEAIPQLLEQNLGKWQGLPHEKMIDFRSQPAHPFWPLSATECPPEGESMTDVYNRVGQFLDQMALQHNGQDMIAITHGGTIRAAIAYALKINIQTALSFSIYNLSLTILEKQAENWRIVLVNELPYMQ